VRRSLEAAAGAYTVLGLFDDVVDLPGHVDYGFLDDYAIYGAAWPPSGSLEVEACGANLDHAPYAALPDKGTFSLGGAPDAARNDLATAWCRDRTQIGATFPGTPKVRNISCQ
jgi:hypothetical protein